MQMRQKDYILNVDLDINHLWITDEAMATEEELLAAQKSGYTFPEDLELVQVDSSQKGSVSAGQVEIYFYKKGYSDHAILHLESQDERKVALEIASFLPDVKFYEKED